MRIRVLFIAVLALLPWGAFASAAPLSAQQPAGIISAPLEETLAEAAGPTQLVPVEVIATGDVAARIKGLGGQVEADIGGTVIAAKVPAGQVPTLAHSSGVTAIFG